MKKLSIIVLALAASLMLSACDGGTYERDDDDDRSGTHEKVDKPNKDGTPDIEPISPSKLEYEFINNGEYGSGIQINAINTAAADIRFPETIDGEPVVYISHDLEYSEKVKTLIFPDTVADCGKMAPSVEFVKLSESITSIGYEAFAHCDNLTSITIPDSVTSIGTTAFWGCSSLTDIHLPDGVTSIRDGAFIGCSSLTSLTIPDSVEYFGSGVFDGCPDNLIITYKGKKYTKANF